MSNLESFLSLKVKKLVQKVLTRDNFNYRKLTDKPLVEGVEKTTLTEIKLDIELLKQLIEGNKKFLPVFQDPTTVGKSPKKGKFKSNFVGIIIVSRVNAGRVGLSFF